MNTYKHAVSPDAFLVHVNTRVVVCWAVGVPASAYIDVRHPAQVASSPWQASRSPKPLSVTSTFVGREGWAGSVWTHVTSMTRARCNGDIGGSSWADVKEVGNARLNKIAKNNFVIVVLPPFSYTTHADRPKL
jgi:hypothetical protein